MSLSDSQFMLQDAKQLLDEIEHSYKKYLAEENIPRELQNKIRNFLNNIESALDYKAFDIFSKCCVKNIPQEKLSGYEKRINFPLKNSKKEFDKYIDTCYLGLRIENPDIVLLFEKHQPFTSDGSNWLTRFNFLVNNNKHRTLMKQKRNQTSNVHHMKLLGANFIGCTFEGPGTPITIGDTPVNFFEQSPYIENLSATVYVDFIFPTINKPALPTLKEIYSGATSVINDLEQII